ncbi:MAG: hypothetical protein EOP06_24440, partial [Proteobacteria bacterium]
MYKLLLDEAPLVVLPSLAVKVGLNEAIVLQQVHYWLVKNREKRNEDNYKKGRYWVYNTYQEWQKVFPFWSLKTVERIFVGLENEGFLIADKLQADKTDRTKWYTIDYDLYRSRVENLEDEGDPLPSRQNDEMQDDKMGDCKTTKRRDAKRQPDVVQDDKVGLWFNSLDTDT